jgi:hypothetical protein
MLYDERLDQLLRPVGDQATLCLLLLSCRIAAVHSRGEDLLDLPSRHGQCDSAIWPYRVLPQS